MLRTQEECQDLEPEADGAVSRAVGDEMPGTYINFYMANGSESEKGLPVLAQVLETGTTVQHSVAVHPLV